MSALATNYIVNNVNYANRDLNTIFAPIGRGAVDYGTFNSTPTYLGNGTAQSFIGEGWCLFNRPIQTASTGNVSVVNENSTSGGGFLINTAGNYKLSISLFFTGANAREIYQKIVFILNSSPIALSTLNITFTPSPTMAQIYSINCSGGASNRDNIDNVNNENLSSSVFASETTGNLLSMRLENTNVNTNPYYFAFFASSNLSNIYTLEITFNITSAQYIYPQIICNGYVNYPDPINTLNGTASKWAFFKL